MASELKMPQLSDTMDAGKILSWKKKEGDLVARGEALAEVETEKANLEIECFQAGTLLKILVPAGSSAKVGEVIAVIGAPGEQITSVATSKPLPPATTADTVSIPTAAPRTVSSSAVARAPQLLPQNAAQADPSERIKISPLARKIAQQHNVDLSVIKGSGPQGRIVKKDIEAQALDTHSPQTTQTEAIRPTTYTSNHPRSNSSTPNGGGKSYPLSRMRETIARRMQESVTQAPHFYVTTAIDMEQALQLREVLKGRPEFKGISINHFVIKAAAYALSQEPRVNYALRDGQVFEPAQINIGIITAVEDGLLIPVIREANLLPLKDIVFEARAAVERAKAGRPSSSDLTGGTFSISNMGMFDVENFTAIINPGQGAVLAVSSVREIPVVKKGLVVAGLEMKVTLSVDHRIIDGVMGAHFLKYFKQALEMPALLMV